MSRPNPFNQRTHIGRATFNRVRVRLTGMFPFAFPAEGVERLPLAIGIHRELAIQFGMSEHDARRFMEVWCDRPRYLAALVIKRFRVDLNGNPVGEVSDEHRQHALAVLEGRHSAGAAAARAMIRLHQITHAKEMVA